MRTLKGRPIGLNARMSEDQMLQQLEHNRQTWQHEGFSQEEIISALIAKARPLINGYYWARYPDAQERCRRALERFLKTYGLNIKFKQKRKITSPKRPEKSFSLLDQFKI